MFEKKFWEKTGIDWSKWNDGVRIDGKYQIVDVQATKEEMAKLIANEKEMWNMLEESWYKPT